MGLTKRLRVVYQISCTQFQKPRDWVNSLIFACLPTAALWYRIKYRVSAILLKNSIYSVLIWNTPNLSNAERLQDC